MENEILLSKSDMSLSQRLQQHTDKNGLARSHALRCAVPLGNLIPPSVSFESLGFALIVGTPEALCLFAAQIPQSQRSCVVFLCLSMPKTDDSIPAEMMFFYSQDIEIEGFLGAFDVKVTIEGQSQNLAKISKGRSQFDLIIDLTEKGVHKAQLLPLGYYAVGRGCVSEANAVAAIEEMKGTFDKPKFFQLDTARCAYSSRRVKGCTRCIDACPADALSVKDNAISINPYLCQGMGSCAMACPTEAISYGLPEPDDTQDYIFQLLQFYQEAKGQSPVLLFYSSESESELAAQIDMLMSNVIPVPLEELASVGIDTWFSALAYGAVHVLLLESAPLHEKTRRVLVKELEVAGTFLRKLGLSSTQISLVTPHSLRDFKIETIPYSMTRKKQKGSKREKLAAALDLLASNKRIGGFLSAVPADAPFGRVDIEANNCTLCLSCVAVCPTNALGSLGTHPGVTFKEQDCVQCGLCQNACPESVISLTPRYNWETQSRQQQEILHEEPAAECLTCGKAFAPVSMVNMLIEKLRDHSHFKDDAIKRLSMCEDCRVRDIFTDMIDDPEKQLKM